MQLISREWRISGDLKWSPTVIDRGQILVIFFSKIVEKKHFLEMAKGFFLWTFIKKWLPRKWSKL